MNEPTSTSDARASRPTLLLLLVLTGGVLIRLWDITQPFVDRWSWRQADMAMIARNFYRHGFHVFWPQVDWAGAAPGYVGSEFPLVPAIAAAAYALVGIQDWVGRAISVISFAIAAWFLYHVLALVTSTRGALLGVVVFSLFPLSIQSGRSFMADMPALACALGAIWSFCEFLDRPGRGAFARVAIWLTVTMLLKLPTAVIGVPMAYIAWSRHKRAAWRHPALLSIAVVSAAAAAAWYLHAWSIARWHEPHHLFGSGGIEIVSARTYGDRVATLVLDGVTPAGALLSVVGVWFRLKRPYAHMLHWWVIACIAGTIVLGHGSRHPWYQLPLLPALAGLCGIALDRIVGASERTRRPFVGWTAAVLLLASLGVLAINPLRMHYLASAAPLREAGLQVRRTTPADSLVVFIDYGDPSGLYYSDRRGWHFQRDFGSLPLTSSHAIAELEDLRAKGATLLVATPDTRWLLEGYFAAFGEHVRSRYEMVSQTPSADIYDLR